MEIMSSSKSILSRCRWRYYNLQAQNIEKYGIVRMKDVGGSYQHLIDWSTEAKEQKRK